MKGFTDISKFMMIAYSLPLPFWVLNLLKGNDGALVHRLFMYTFYLAFWTPFYVIFKINVINTGYGSESEVAASSEVGGDAKFITTKANDPYYSSSFLLTYLVTII